MRLSILASATALSLSLALGALAADAPKMGLARGTVENFDGKTLTLVTTAGAVTGAITPKTAFFTVEPRKFAELTSKDFVGITSVDEPNGHIKAEEIHVIPIVGVGEGQYPWDHHPESAGGATRAGTMTNGMMAPMPQRAGTMTNGMVTTGANAELTVTYHGSEMVNGKCEGHATIGGSSCTGVAVVDVPPETPIVALVRGTADDVKPGLTAVAGTAVVNGQTYIGSITVEKNGVKPAF